MKEIIRKTLKSEPFRNISGNIKEVGYMELKTLKAFCTVVEHGSFSAAADILCITQPAVSLQIRSLEEELGVVLFNRAYQKIILTESGNVVYEYAKRILTLVDELSYALDEINSLAKGKLRIGASTIVGEYVLPSLLADFKKTYPNIDISLHIGDTVEVIDDVLKGEVEIGVVGANIVACDIRERLRFEKFIEEELTLIVPAKHKWVEEKSIELSRLKEEPFILRSEGSGARMTLEKRLEEVGLKDEDLNVVMELGNTEAIKKSVASGIGISIVPKKTIENELRLGLLKEININNVDLSMKFYIVYDEHSLMSKVSEAFLRLLRARR
jgi:DNA-binding transcriptional LysR family regulator